MGWKRYYGYRRTKFSSDLHKHIEARCDKTGRRPPKWNQWTDGVYPRLRQAAKQPVRTDSVVLHPYAAHLRSSQVFAFNLFLPFRDGGRDGLRERPADLLGVPLSIDRIQFEWVPPGPLLGEIDGERPFPDEPATAVDRVPGGRVGGSNRAWAGAKHGGPKGRRILWL